MDFPAGYEASAHCSRLDWLGRGCRPVNDSASGRHHQAATDRGEITQHFVIRDTTHPPAPRPFRADACRCQLAPERLLAVPQFAPAVPA